MKDAMDDNCFKPYEPAVRKPTNVTGLDPETETYKTSFEPDTDSPTTAIVTPVTLLSDNDPQDLPPLHDTNSVDALNTLFQPTPNGGTPSDAQLSFTYHGIEIPVT